VSGLNASPPGSKRSAVRVRGFDALGRELKRSSTEVLILALLDEHDRHGYDLARLIGARLLPAHPAARQAADAPRRLRRPRRETRRW
jgi:hypothetical protein